MSTNNIFLLWGDKYLINEKIQELIKEIARKSEETPELNYLDADEISITQLQNELNYNSLFSLAKIILIKEPYWLHNTKRKASEARQVLEFFKQYVSEEYPQQYLILTTDDIYEQSDKKKDKKKSEMIKLLEKSVALIECPALNKGNLSKWIIDQLKTHNLEASKDVVAKMAESGQDMYYLENLIEKLALRKVINITPEHLQEELEDNQDVSIFNLTNALLEKNIKGALGALHKLKEAGTPTPLFIFMINNQFMALGKVKAALEKGVASDQLASVTKLNPYVARNMQAKVRRFNWQQLWEIFALLLDADIKLKTISPNEGLLMEALIIEICNKK